uniref:Uncharacterized protein n=1 Tax=Anguilla anguilla TaxID=7936 RepID=A0A0E9SVS9_ANGAN
MASYQAVFWLTLVHPNLEWAYVGIQRV